MADSKLSWSQTGEREWTSTNGWYVLLQNGATGNVFIYRVTHSSNAPTGQHHWNALLNARYKLADAKEYAQEQYDAERKRHG